MVFKCGHFKLQGSQNKERGSFLTTALLSWARSCQLQASGGISVSEGLGTEKMVNGTGILHLAPEHLQSTHRAGIL